ncbi:MAG: hypothetical protein D6800_12540 [Candidatus Zixiibacteriota bacterium]|nr:MAG: hypothetical protein D6800_12540 [candidate division Zixibacteria bacterium]
MTVPPLADEQTDANNQQTLPVKILKSRAKVLVVSESADYELGFLTRFLRQSDKYDVTLILTGDKVGNLSGRFPSGQTELNRYDLVVLYDPVPGKIKNHANELRSYLNDRNGAIWMLMGSHYAAQAPVPWLDSLLPFAPSQRVTVKYTDVRAEPVEGQLFHPALRLADDRAAIRSAWHALPPFRVWVPCDSIHPRAVILARASTVVRGGKRAPIMGYRRLGGGKVFATAAGPFWTWGFVGLGVNESIENYGRFLNGVLSWLTTPEDYTPLAIQPERQVYNRGEAIKFRGHAFDQGYRPLPDVTGVIALTDEKSGERYEADLIDKGNGAFEAEFTGIPPGTYKYAGRFEKGGTLLKESKGRLRVEQHSLEEANPGGMPANLQAIARLSGGKYVDWTDFDRAVNDMSPHPIVQNTRAEFTLWGRSWLLFLIVGALSLEWLVRKMNQLL